MFALNYNSFTDSNYQGIGFDNFCELASCLDYDDIPEYKANNGKEWCRYSCSTDRMEVSYKSDMLDGYECAYWTIISHGLLTSAHSLSDTLILHNQKVTNQIVASIKDAEKDLIHPFDYDED